MSLKIVAIPTGFEPVTIGLEGRAKASIFNGSSEKQLAFPCGTDGETWNSEKQLYIYRWDRQGRKGQTCKVMARGKFNSICVVFEDGYTMITSGNAIRKAVRAA